MNNAYIKAIDYYLPARVLNNDELATIFPELTAKKIEQKTGIAERRIAADGECASDLAEQAARQLFAKGACRPVDIDFLLFCTQSPDYFLPTTACLLQHRLGLPTSAGALDYPLGCSGYIYGLSMAKALIASAQAKNVLILTGETYSKHMEPNDRSVRTIFGDAGSATLVTGSGHTESSGIGTFIFGTDGSGADHLIVRNGGMRSRNSTGIVDDHLFMNGPEVFNFTLRVVPECIAALLAQEHINIEQVDGWVFHQANAFMLEHLRQKIGIPKERFFVNMRDCGNTVSSTIPIALARTLADGGIVAGQRIGLVGFGVGLSWGATTVAISQELVSHCKAGK